jgi:hypothetical protein
MRINKIIAAEIIIIIVLIILGIWYFYLGGITFSGKAVSATAQTYKLPASVESNNNQHSSPDYSSLLINLPKNQMIQDLPEGKSLYLQTFSFSSGTRVWEKSFIVGKSTMKEGKLDNAEVTLTIHSKYVNQITSSNLCDILRTANKNKDLGFESSLDYVSLAWKYSSLMKYKSCFS